MNTKTLHAIALLGGIAFLTGCPHHDEEKIAMKPPQGTPKRPAGGAALTVRVGTAQPFTQQDVTDYFQAHNLPKNGVDFAGSSVASLEFLTSREVSQRLQGEPTGLADTDRMGFATLIGNFVFTGPPGKTARFTRAYAAFDATTGNLMMVGTLAEQRRPPLQ